MIIRENELRAIIREELQKELQIQEGPANIALDVIGMVPVVGEMADLLNAISYADQGEWLFSALSLISMVPAIGDAVGKGTKLGMYLGKGAEQIKKLKVLLKANETTINDFLDKVKEEEKFEKIHEHIPKIREAITVFLGSDAGEESEDAAPVGGPGPGPAAPEGV